MGYKIVTDGSPADFVTTGQMKVGDVLVAEEKGRYILRAGKGWVDLSQPLYVWSDTGQGPCMKGRLLAPGERIILEGV